MISIFNRILIKIIRRTYYAAQSSLISENLVAQVAVAIAGAHQFSKGLTVFFFSVSPVTLLAGEISSRPSQFCLFNSLLSTFHCAARFSCPSSSVTRYVRLILCTLYRSSFNQHVNAILIADSHHSRPSIQRPGLARSDPARFVCSLHLI